MNLLTEDVPDLALLTDLYELTMLQAYWAEGMNERAVFSLHFRDLPHSRNFMLACGQGQLLDTITQLRFTRAALDRLAAVGPFSETFLRYLEDFRFTGDVYAMPEGTPVFAHEPIVEIEAPIGEAQLLETLVMNQVHVQTVLASSAIRFRLAAGDRLSLVDFGMRRSHGADAAVQGVRAYWIAGLEATSNVLAGSRYGVPVRGTMAHSYIQSHVDERTAFEAFSKLYPGSTLLVDTYDSMRGLDHAISLAQAGKISFGAIRLDSGDLLALSIDAREKLDAAGFPDVGIFVSGGLDEFRLRDLVDGNAPIAGCGVGSHLATSADAPTLELTYKLTEYAGTGRTKTSPGKRVYPGRKQVFRMNAGKPDMHDVLAGRHEVFDGTPLLQQVMRGGEIIDPDVADHHAARERARLAVAQLPQAVKSIDRAATPYDVLVSPWLKSELEQVIARTAGQ